MSSVTKKSLSVTLALMALVVFAVSALAVDVTMLTPTISVSAPITTAVETLLESGDPPSAALHYVITSADLDGVDYYVSVAGVINVVAPDYRWRLDENAIYTGMMLLVPDGIGGYTASYYTPSMPADFGGGVGGGPGGGPGVIFPWRPGTKAAYGSRGVHSAGYGESGMVAVDFVGGPNYGSNSMPPNIYASTDGVVNYVCKDPYSVTVKTNNTTTGDRFIYAHLQDNATLVSNTVFTRGQQIGILRSGSFCTGDNPPPDCSCGWGSQSDTSYHIHWGFIPAGGFFQAESWVLNTVTTKWTKGAELIATGGSIVSTGSAGSGVYTAGTDDVQIPVMWFDPQNPGNIQLSGGHIWDWVIMGLYRVIDVTILSWLPVHIPSALFERAGALLITVVRTANMVLAGRVSFVVVFAVTSAVLVSETVYWFYALARLVSKLIDTFPFA